VASLVLKYLFTSSACLLGTTVRAY
jgi:hypothetical protein